MQFIARFVNGYWRVLDLHEYREVGIHSTQALALRHAETANLEVLSGKPKKRKYTLITVPLLTV